MTASFVIPPPRPLIGAATGLAAGVAASWAMTRFQNAAAPLFFGKDSGGGGGGTPATEVAADRIASGATGRDMPDDRKPMAGEAVHYGFGAALGMLYGLLGEYRPAVTAGRGAAFGIATATIADEALVPAAGLSGPPWQSGGRTHLYSYASHIVFGVACDMFARLLRGGIARTA